MDNDVVKPPWHSLDFQSSPMFEQAMIERLLRVPFDVSWNELPHVELTEMKEKIAPLESNHKWELLKKKSNPYELVYTQETAECPHSVALLKPLSRSYFKMIEMLQVSQFFDRLPKGTQKLRSSHVAEGPGGFIEAFLDKAETHRLKVQKSYAITLKPTTNHVPGWRRSYQFLQRHPEVKIHYGVDGTGDIYVPENQTSFVQLHELTKSYLFTGDGGFDFSTDYENQEKSVYPLLVSSALIGIQVLAPEGTLVLKLFDTYTSVTQFFIRCVSLCFREWYLYKPLTSRPCNSERYLICRGFRKAYPYVVNILMTLQSRWRQFQTVPQVEFFSFCTDQEKAYLDTHIHEFTRLQMENLQKTLDLQTIAPSDYQWKEQYALATRWCLDFHVPTHKVKT